MASLFSGLPFVVPLFRRSTAPETTEPVVVELRLGKFARVCGCGVLSQTELVTGLSGRAQQRRPILKVGSKNFLDHAARKFRNQTVQRNRRISFFVGQPGPK